MSQSTFSGPVKAGTIREGASANLGNMTMMKAGTIAQNSTAAVSSTLILPASSRILGFYIDVVEAFDSATSATLTIGTAAAGSQYVGSVNAKSAGRAAPTLSTAQLTAMSSIGTNTSVICTVTPAGTTTAGAVKWAVLYAQV